MPDDAPRSTPPKPAPSPFSFPDYRAVWAARLFASLAVMSESVAIGWQVYAIARRSHSVQGGAFLVGMAGLCEFLPILLLTFVAGPMADRRDRRTIVAVSLAVEVACALVLTGHALSGARTLWPIFLTGAVLGGARAFLGPAQSAMAPTLAPPAALPQAVAASSLAWQGAAVAGPLIGGALLAISPAFAFGACVALYAASGACVLAIRADTRPKAQPGDHVALAIDGLRYVWSNKIVLGAISLDLFAVLFGGATALLPIYARDVLHVGAGGFGVLRMGPAIGAVGVALWLMRRPLRRRAGLWMFFGVVVFALATLVFAVSRDLRLSVAMLALLGAADMISVYVRQSLVQITTPDAMRGRVSAASGLFVGASNELGEFETGVVASLIGPVGAAIFGGVGALVVVGLWAWLFPALRRADRMVAEPETPAPTAMPEAAAV